MMLRIVPPVAFCLPLLAALAAAAAVPAAPAAPGGAAPTSPLAASTAPPPATAPAATTPAAKTIDVSTLDQLRAALGLAGHTPNTHIRLTADIVSTAPALYIRGEGTDIDGNGHRVGYRYAYDGTAGGCGFCVMPDLSKPEKADPNAQNVIFCNAQGTVQGLETAAGGTIGSAKDHQFFEPAPVRYWDQPRPGVTFTQMRHIFTPAQNITIHDATFAVDHPQAWGAMSVAWARNVSFRDVHFTYFPTTTLTNCNVTAQESQNVSFVNCDFGGWACGFNSTLGGTVDHCKNGGVSTEEDCHRIKVTNSSLYVVFVADATCGDITITGNTIKNDHALAKNWGAIPIREISGNNLVENNTLLDGTASEGTLWTGFIVPGGTLVVKGNKGKTFTRPRITTGLTETDNTWVHP